MNINNFIKFAEEASKNTKDNTQPPKYNTQPPKSNNRFDNPEMWQRSDIKGPVDTSKMPVVGWEREPMYYYDADPANSSNVYRDSDSYKHLKKFLPHKVLTQEERQKQFGKSLENANPPLKLGQHGYNNFLEILDYLNASKDNSRKYDNTIANLESIDSSPLMQGDITRKAMRLPNPLQSIRDIVRKTERYGSLWPMLHANGAFTGHYEEDSMLDEALNRLRELSKKYY